MMSALSAWYLDHIQQANESWAKRSLFWLKQLFALAMVTTISALIVAALWLAFTRSIYLVLAFCAILVIGILVPYVCALPMLYPRRSRLTRAPTDLGLTRWDEAHFFSTDGIPLKGWFIPPDPQSNGATLVLVHGLGANREQLLEQALTMIAKGYGVLLFDLRNHGTSGSAITTLGYTEAEDVIGAVNYVLSRPEVNPRLIGDRSPVGEIAQTA